MSTLFPLLPSPAPGKEAPRPARWAACVLAICQASLLRPGPGLWPVLPQCRPAPRPESLGVPAHESSPGSCSSPACCCLKGDWKGGARVVPSQADSHHSLLVPCFGVCGSVCVRACARMCVYVLGFMIPVTAREITWKIQVWRVLTKKRSHSSSASYVSLEHKGLWCLVIEIFYLIQPISLSLPKP